MRKEYRVPFMRVPAVLLAMATLLCANIATAMPSPASIKVVSLCKVADSTVGAPCGVLPAPQSAGRPAARPHMAVSWVVRQAYRGNFHPIVTGIQIEAKKLRFELRTFFSVALLGETAKDSASAA
jgi:hypothetical protein